MILMELKANNPVLVGVAVLVIILAIFYVQSMKAGMANSLPPAGNDSAALAQKQALFQKAPELQGITGYINAPEGFKLADVKGKVVLVDFWTYSCINCIRTLPYLTAWDEKYRDQGLVIVGVHTPEFEFEKDKANVEAAAKKYHIGYPIVQDNDYATWRAYGNRFWPHKYLIDADGFIRYDHIGEGGYEETEQMIQKLLMERDSKVNMTGLAASNITEETPTGFTTPEIYLGYSFAIPRGQPIGNPGSFRPEESFNYTLPMGIQPNVVYFDGVWNSAPDGMELASDSGKVVLHYRAKNVNIVAGGNSTIEVLLDNEVPVSSQAGSDVMLQNGKAFVSVEPQRLYNVVADTDYYDKTVELDVHGKGFKLYTFTFG
jgi:thiol-disulfide isomerase/thioredoxin